MPKKPRLVRVTEEVDSRCVYQRERKVLKIFQDFKDITRRTASDKILRDKAFNITKRPNMMDINVDLL